MNKVYFAYVDEDYGGVHIAADNIKLAKQYARYCEIISDHIERYIDLKINLCRDIDRKPIRTEYEGELNIVQILECGLVWWNCAKCEGAEFEIITYQDINDKYKNGRDAYKCKDCGYVDIVPYVNI